MAIKRYQESGVIMLIMIMAVLLLIAKCQPISIVSLQDSFNKRFCGGCDHENCQQTMQAIQELTGFKLTGQPIINNALNVKTVFLYTNSTNKIYNISGKTSNFTTDYLLAVPILEKQSQFKGVVAYFHDTKLQKDLVPTFKHDDFLALVGLYCSQGFAVVLADLIGMGRDYQNTHPNLLYPQTHAQTMSHSLNHAYGLLSKMFSIEKIPVFLAGFSEGGLYSLWFTLCWSSPSKCPYFTQILNRNYIYKKTAGLSGTYDLKQTLIPFLTEKITDSDENPYQIQEFKYASLVKPSTSALIIAGHAAYSATPYSLGSVFNDKFFQMNCTDVDQFLCNIGPAGRQIHRNISAALAEGNLNQQDLKEAIGRSAFGKSLSNEKYATFDDWGMGRGGNSILSIIKDSTIYSKSFNDSVEAATLIGKGYPQAKNTFLFTLNLDSNISPLHTQRLKQNVSGFSSIAFDNTQYRVCMYRGARINSDHIRIETLANVYALKYFNQSLKDKKSLKTTDQES